MIAEASAPAKVILAGEHFVVHGGPALAVPLPACRLTVRRAEPRSCEGPLERVPVPHREHIWAMLKALEREDAAVGLEISSSIPVGAGLGSSAALAVALVRALDTAPAEVRARAHRLERLTHGKPSGLDDAVVSAERPVWLNPPDEPLSLASSALSLWVGVTPERTATREAVARVAARAERDPGLFQQLLERASRQASVAREALDAQDWGDLGRAMDQGHALLKELGVSTSALDRLVAAARKAGAFGAKLTGGGMGGAMVALAPPDLDLSSVLNAAGASEVIAS